ncbi:hypothetical protein ACFFQW_38515 [Umezawaea endophytica]|uniref:Terpene synthase n=1 Tax=Umezawaea endophytica TaxID=1654476 RepID=A0A9X3A6Y8_9PSEU|nr:hypothetical protein [Umezawaea endophytica]MCS7483838.1 hypothetical protein [Umezawaea endophytica]
MPILDERTLRLPFPTCSSPFAEAAEVHVRQWARRFEMVRGPESERRFAETGFGICAGYVQADASSAALNVYAKWLAWLFLVNDQHGEGVYETPETWLGAVRHLRPVFETGEVDNGSASTPAARALADVLGHVYPVMSPAWRKRFSRHCWETIEAVVPESDRRRRERVPGVDEYISNRRLVSAGIPLFDLCEFMAGRELPDDVREHPAYREMVMAASEVMAWCNDVASLEKEEAAGEVDNFVLVLEVAEGLDRSRAVEAVVERVRHRVEEYLLAERSINTYLASRAPNFETWRVVDYCIRSMRHWMVGNVRWSQLNPRYTVSQSHRQRSRPPHVVDLLSTRAG